MILLLSGIAGGLALLSSCAEPNSVVQVPPDPAPTPRRSPAGPSRFVLGNGMVVILEPSPQDTRVAMESFYRAGVIHEPEGGGQLAHLTEHAVVYGSTESFGPYQAAPHLQAQGMANAETLGDFVHFDAVFDPEFLERALRIETERLVSLGPGPGVVEQEIPRCRQEIDNVARSPQGSLIKFGLSALNQTLRYGQAPVSLYRTLETLTVDDVRAFHRDRYATDGSVLVLVGGFDPVETRRLVEETLGRVPRSELPPLPPFSLSDDRTVAWDLPRSAVYLTTSTVPKTPTERIALLLFGNRLNQLLAADPELSALARSTFATNHIYPVGDLPFFVYAETRPGATPQALAAALQSVLHRGRDGWDPGTHLASRTALSYFLDSSLLAQGSPPTSQPRDQILAQEAINTGMRELQCGALSPKEYRTLLRNLTFEDVREAIDAHLEHLIEIRFVPGN